MWKISTILRTLWMGRYSLGKAFWLFFCLGFIAIIFIGMAAGLPFLLLNFEKPIPSLVFWIVFLGYEIVASVGVWRSANALLTPRGKLITGEQVTYLATGERTTYAAYAKVLAAKLIVIITMVTNIMRFTGINSIDQIMALLARIIH